MSIGDEVLVVTNNQMVPVKINISNFLMQGKILLNADLVHALS